MLQGIISLFDDPISDLLLAGMFVLVALQHREIRLLRHKSNERVPNE
jgi:hypothetical protein